MTERKITHEGEIFIVRPGKDECSLTVTNGDDKGQVTWHEATRRYRGDFEGWGSDAESVDQAVTVVARRILKNRRGVSRQEACEAMENYIKDADESA